MRRSIATPLMLAWLLLCAPEVGAQVRPSTAVRDALFAQLFGPGGCSSIETYGERGDSFFEGVRIVEGRCTAEHGDEGRAFVAIDSAGIIFVLDSPSGINFLVRRHPVLTLDSATILVYAERVARLTRSLPAHLQLVQDPDEIPAGIWARMDLTPAQAQPTALEHWQPTSGMARVSLLAYGPGHIAARSYVIHVPSGMVVSGAHEDHWARSE